MILFSEEGMTPVKYLKKNGIKKACKVMYESKLDVIFRRVLVAVFSGKQPKDIIVIESHSDFDCNGGAFYEYLIANSFNRSTFGNESF